MKAVRRALPVVLMVWPYLFILYTMLPDGFSESVYIGFLISYIILTVVIYALNIWNAFTYQSEDAEYKLAFYDMMIKIVHIPFYLGVFAIGVLFIAAMVVPALLFFSPIVVLLLVIIDFLLMITSSIYGISAAVKSSRKGILSKKSGWLYGIFHCLFVSDVVSAILLFAKIKKSHKKTKEKIINGSVG